MRVKIGTFNAENLFLRYKFLATEAGSMGKKKVDISKFISEGGNINMLDGGFDRYPYSMLIDGNDMRKIDVGILSKLEIGQVRTHQFDKDAEGEIFSRDCLEADIILDKKENKCLTVFVNHLKSRLGDVEGTSDKRVRQSTRIAQIIQERFGNDKNACFAVLGDFNDTPESECFKPLLSELKLENVVSRLPKNEQWTYYWKNKKETNQFDYILLSGAISKKSKDLPVIERRGLADYAKAFKGKRFAGVGPVGTEASDHCAVFMELDV